MTFRSVASLLMPAGQASGVVVEADLDWHFDAAGLPNPLPDVVVWGRGPSPSGESLSGVARSAERRERAILALRRHPPRELKVAAVHRWPPARLIAGAIRQGARTALLSGALVELRGREVPRRVLDVAAEMAGGPMHVRRFCPGTGDSIMVWLGGWDGSGRLLRVAPTGGADDPRPAAEALEKLTRLGIRGVPRLLGRGATIGASWTVESVLPGRRAKSLTPRLIAACARFCARLPRADGPPTAPARNLNTLAERFPEHGSTLHEVSEKMTRTVQGLPGVMGHGDFWAGNLLVSRGELSGVIDWDAWFPAGMPGADLLHLLGTDVALRSRRDLGEVWLQRPWRADRFVTTTASYWQAFGIRPYFEILDTAGLAWWAASVAHSVRRLPHLTEDRRWVTANIDSVVASLRGGGGPVAE